MKVKPSSHFYLGILLWSICCFATSGILVAKMSAQAKQVDIIILEPLKGRVSPLGAPKEKEIVDVKEAARNLRNKEIFRKAEHALASADNAYLSSGTVNLLRMALNDKSEEVRIRAITLLGLSRNREAIKLISNNLQQDPSRRVRWSSAVNLGRLAGEEAIPALKDALVKDREITPAVISGLGYAGGAAVPILLQMLEDKFRKHRVISVRIIRSLENTCDRRAIETLIDILLARSIYSSASSDLDSRLAAADVLAHFATEYYYSGLLKIHSRFLAAQHTSPSVIWKLTATDRARIIDALENVLSDSEQVLQEFVSKALEEIQKENALKPLSR